MSIMHPGRQRLILPPRRVAMAAPGEDNARNDQPLPPLERSLAVVAANYDINTAPVGGSGTATTVFFFVHNPSPRLRVSLTVGWELLGNNPFALGAGTAATWQLTAVRLRVAGGSASDLDTVFVNGSGVATARALPDGYEIDSAVRDLRGQLTLHQGSNQDLAAGLFGALVVEARWEPHDGVYSEDLRQLIAAADLRVQGGAALIGVL